MKIVAISDLHGTLPSDLPECDLLIVAGDLCPDIFDGRHKAHKDPERQLRWFHNVFADWADAQRADFVLATWGNHDFCGHLLPNSQVTKKLEVISDGYALINGVKVWMTPWSNQFMNWAWMKQPAALEKVYAEIHDDTDILVSHQPPRGCGDIYPNLESGQLEHIGSVELLEHIERIRPRAVICGHLHSGHGTYLINGRTDVFNVSILDEQYKRAYPPTVFTYAE